VPTRPTYAQERLHEAVLCLAVGTAPIRERLEEALRCAARALNGPGLGGRLRAELEALLSVAAPRPAGGDDEIRSGLQDLDDVDVVAIAETLVALSWQLARARFAPTPASILQLRADASGGVGLSERELSLIFKCPRCRAEVDFGVGRGEPASDGTALRVCGDCGAELTLVAVGDEVSVAEIAR
jgi:hypothetical protein